MRVESCRATVLASSLGAAALLVVSGCAGGSAGKYAGSYKRDLYGEGEVQMQLASDGTIELKLPERRWADNPTMKGKATFKGDTLIFAADTSMAKCATGEAKYVLSKDGENLQVAGVGIDPCGMRRAALTGSWQKA